MSTLVSVIVPIYNTEEYLDACINSILNQSYKNLEVILVNDGSTDNSGKVCEEFKIKDPRIIILNKENGGVSEARNMGIDIAKGDYIGFVDSDDYIEENMYETLLNLCQENKAEISIASCKYHGEGKITTRLNSDKIEVLSKDEALIDLLGDVKIQSYMCNKLYKAELFEGIRFPIATIMEDVHVNFKLFKKVNRVVSYHTPLYNYITRMGSLSHSSSHKKNKDAFMVILNRFFEIQEEFPEIQRANDSSLILWMARTYSFIVRTNDTNDEYFKKHFPLFEEVYTRQKRFITEDFSPDKMIIIYSMLWNYEKGKAVIKKLYEYLLHPK